MTRGDARTELKARGFDYLLDGRCNTMLENAKTAFEDVYPWPWLEILIEAPAPVLIANLKYVLHVVDKTNKRELVGVKAQDIVAQFDADLDATGTPELWWLDGTGTLNVYPVNTSNLISVRYVRESPELATDSDSPLIPTRYHPIWIDFAVVQAYKDSDNYEQAQALQSDLDRRLTRIVEVYETRNRQNADYQIIRPESLLYGDW